MLITVIIPVYNKGMSIGSTILKTKKYANNIIVVDKGSTDDTADIAQLAGANIIRHTVNRGNEDALKVGLNVAIKNGTEIIVALDMDDIGHDIDNKYYIDIIPETIDYIDIIPETIDYISDNNYDMVAGSWNGNKKVECLTFSVESLKSINMAYINGSFIVDLLSQAERYRLKIKYLNFNDKINKDRFNQFNGYDIGVVVPAYNEEKLIYDTINGIPRYVKKIYAIDDCSTDGTPEIIENINDPRLTYVRHKSNLGVGAAIITGYKLALNDNMDLVVVMAGDNQMDPEQLPKLLRPIIEHRADYTKGNRLINKDFRKGMSKWRSFGNGLLTMITKIGSGYWHVMDPQNGYTAISRQALETIDLDSIFPYYGYCNDILIKMNAFGMRIEDVAIPARYGNEKSKIKYGKYIAKVAPMIFRGFLWRLKTKYMIMDFHPLVFFYFTSMILLPSGIFFGLWILYQKIYHNTVSPNFPLLSVFMTLMGLQLLLFAMLFDMQADRSRRMEI